MRQLHRPIQPIYGSLQDLAYYLVKAAECLDEWNGSLVYCDNPIVKELIRDLERLLQDGEPLAKQLWAELEQFDSNL